MNLKKSLDNKMTEKRPHLVVIKDPCKAWSPCWQTKDCPRCKVDPQRIWNEKLQKWEGRISSVKEMEGLY